MRGNQSDSKRTPKRPVKPASYFPAGSSFAYPAGIPPTTCLQEDLASSNFSVPPLLWSAELHPPGKRRSSNLLDKTSQNSDFFTASFKRSSKACNRSGQFAQPQTMNPPLHGPAVTRSISRSTAAILVALVTNFYYWVNPNQLYQVCNQG